jgi:peptide/nickel transport system substrate-binding protein
MKKVIWIAMVIFFLLSVPSIFAASAPSQPQRGGTLRILTNVLPTNFGNPKLVSGGKAPIFGCLEQLINLDAQGNVIPMLATSWDTDPVKKTITYHLRKGVKFHDGTEFNAAAVKWNLEQRLESKQISGGEFITSIDVIDNFTVRFNLKQYSALFPTTYPFLSLMYSPTAIQTKGEEWSRTNPVGTGPYKFVEYRRDASLKFARFDGYWGGQPYLDGVEFRIVSDPMTASASIQAGEGDAWFSTTGLPPKEVVDLRQKGLTASSFPGFMLNLIPDSMNPDSPYSKKGVREAVEYAIDRVSMAKTMGYGLMDAASQMAVPSSAGYNRDYKGRAYDPAKAKQLLAEAGYANGFKTKIILQSSVIYRDAATAIQGYLAAVGIDVQLDVADTARFYSLTWDTTGKGAWKDSLILSNMPLDPGLLFSDMFIRYFKPGARFVSLARSPEFADLLEKCYAATDTATVRSRSQQMVKQVSDDAMVIPILTIPYPLVTQKYVHTKFLTVPCPGVWDMSSDWMEKK